MEYLQGFWNNLGNKYTSALISFLTGFIIGQSLFTNRNILMGIFIGLVFLTVSLLISYLFETFTSENITLTINLNSVFTIILLALFFYIVITLPNVSQLLSTVSDKLEEK